MPTSHEDEFALPISLQVKAVLLGDWAVGKTQLLRRFLAAPFDAEYHPSSLDNFSFNVSVSDESVHVGVWGE